MTDYKEVRQFRHRPKTELHHVKVCNTNKVIHIDLPLTDQKEKKRGSSKMKNKNKLIQQLVMWQNEVDQNLKVF